MFLLITIAKYVARYQNLPCICSRNKCKRYDRRKEVVKTRVFLSFRVIQTLNLLVFLTFLYVSRKRDRRYYKWRLG